MSDQDPMQPPPDERPPISGGMPPQYGATPPPYGATPPPYGAGPAPLDDAQTRQWASLAHLGGILFFLPSLIIWLVYRDRSGFVGQEAKKALNFQITVAFGYVACTILSLASVPFTGLLRLAIWVVAIVFSVQGYLAVQRGQAYRYPVTLELIK